MKDATRKEDVYVRAQRELELSRAREALAWASGVLASLDEMESLTHWQSARASLDVARAGVAAYLYDMRRVIYRLEKAHGRART